MTFSKTQDFKQLGKRYLRSIWLFPSILAVIVVILSALQINGSSIGAYHSLFYGKAPDQSLLFNGPRPIRSDEWLVTTQKTIAQSESNFPRVNTHIGNGEDVSIMDVPYKEWSTVFRPLITFLFFPR